MGCNRTAMPLVIADSRVGTGGPGVKQPPRQPAVLRQSDLSADTAVAPGGPASLAPRHAHNPARSPHEGAVISTQHPLGVVLEVQESERAAGGRWTMSSAIRRPAPERRSFRVWISRCGQ
jgi:hypothetical protein